MRRLISGFLEKFCNIDEKTEIKSSEKEDFPTRAEILDKGWLRGVFVDLLAEDNSKLLALLPLQIQSKVREKRKAYLVPTLYDCGVINGSLEKEPWVPYTVVWDVEFEKQYAGCRDSRCYHFPLLVNEEECSFEATSLGIHTICRMDLLNNSILTEDVSWVDDGLNILLEWVTDRQIKPTFPDSLDKRFNKKKGRFKTFHSSPECIEYISGIYIELSTYEELPVEEEYSGSFLLVYPESVVGRDFLKPNGPSEQLEQNFRSILSTVKGFELGTVQMYPESKFTKDHQRKYKKMDLDKFTYSNEHDVNETLPAEKEANRKR